MKKCPFLILITITSVLDLLIRFILPSFKKTDYRKQDADERCQAWTQTQGKDKPVVPETPALPTELNS